MENTNNNIETIDFGKKTGSVDLSMFYDLHKHLQFQAEVCEETRKMIDDAMQNIISESGLDTIDFKPHNVSNFQNGLANADGVIHGITMTGYDKDYQYITSIITEFDLDDEDMEEAEDDYDFSIDDDYDELADLCTSDEDELEITYAENIHISLVRIGLHKDNDYYRYNFEKKGWDIIGYEELAEAAGYTAKQLKMIESGSDLVKTQALEVYKNEFGMISDKDFDFLIKKNKAILELYKRTSRFTSLFLLNEYTFAVAPAAMVDGGYVECINGTLQLSACFIDTKIKIIKETPKISEMTKVLKCLFDKYLPEETLALIPLSPKNYVMIFASGKMEFAHSVTPEEEQVLQAYIEYAEQISGEMEEE